MIWFNKELKAADLAPLRKNTLVEHMNIQVTEVGPDFLRGTMPVDHTTVQPYGLLHGGASCVLAETLGSLGSAYVVDQSKFYCVGLEINANHVRGMRSGLVTGTARPVHLGGSTHVWEIKIEDENGKLICVSRLTVMIVPRKDQA